MTQFTARRRGMRGVLAAGAAASTLLVGGLVAATQANAAPVDAEVSQQSGVGRASAAALPEWPSADGEQKVDDTIEVDGTLDGGMTRYYGISSGDQGESQPTRTSSWARAPVTASTARAPARWRTSGGRTSARTPRRPGATRRRRS